MDNPRGQRGGKKRRESLCFELGISFDFWPDLHCSVSRSQTSFSPRQLKHSLCTFQLAAAPGLGPLLCHCPSPGLQSLLSSGRPRRIPGKLEAGHSERRLWAFPLPRPPSPQPWGPFPRRSGYWAVWAEHSELPLQGLGALAEGQAPAETFWNLLGIQRRLPGCSVVP